MKIRDGNTDVLSLGECMVRLSPRGHQRIEFANEFEAWVGGGEYNVAYAATRMGLNGGCITRMVDNPVGHMIRNHARAAGMDVSNIVWIPYDGVGRADRVGLNFTEVGTSVRGSVTMYDRGHSACSHFKPGDVDWKKLFGKRCHPRGINGSPSASPILQPASPACRAPHQFWINSSTKSYRAMV